MESGIDGKIITTEKQVVRALILAPFLLTQKILGVHGQVFENQQTHINCTQNAV